MLYATSLVPNYELGKFPPGLDRDYILAQDIHRVLSGYEFTTTLSLTSKPCCCSTLPLSLARQCTQPGIDIGGGVSGFSTTDVYGNHFEDVFLLEADGLQLIHARKDLLEREVRGCVWV
jgi:hypothetical protein